MRHISRLILLINLGLSDHLLVFYWLDLGCILLGKTLRLLLCNYNFITLRIIAKLAGGCHYLKNIG